MLSKEMIDKAIANGKEQAREVLEFRNRELERRKRAISDSSCSSVHISEYALNQTKFNQLGPNARDVLIAEGDSWFDYPFYDVLRILEDYYGYEVESVADKGDTIEEMAYSNGQLEKLTRLIEKILRRNIIPRAILLSGGGNDLARDDFGMLLDHFASPIAGLNNSVAEGIINERVKVAYIKLISEITTVCQERIGKSLPIIIHGYDYPVPDGRGFLGGWWLLPGPWLEPGFSQKGFTQLLDRIKPVNILIDRLNDMLKAVASLPDFQHVHYINLRGILQSSLKDEVYKEDWDNEIHPSAEGFKKVTKEFAKRIESLP